jgi:hypothetical protein
MDPSQMASLLLVGNVVAHEDLWCRGPIRDTSTGVPLPSGITVSVTSGVITVQKGGGAEVGIRQVAPVTPADNARCGHTSSSEVNTTLRTARVESSIRSRSKTLFYSDVPVVAELSASRGGQNLSCSDQLVAHPL